MKTTFPLLLFAISLLFFSCDREEQGEYAEYLVAKPVFMSKAEFRNSIDIVVPGPIEQSGKIYAFGDLIFVNDKFKGVHVIDNSNPTSPRKRSFIKIPGNVDISIKDHYLYADSLSDLIVLDISDIENIRVVTRLENVLQDNVVWPAEAQIFEYEGFNSETDVLVGWEVERERRLVADVERQFADVLTQEAASDAGTGQGGSLARFKIVEDYLYAVDNHFINVFDITDLENPQAREDVYAGFDIETIFNRGQQLFLGSMRGMYIYDISSPDRPQFIAEFEHGTACDPVVVDGAYAYVTLRGGNNCGALESGLFIVDITSISQPVLVKSYPMDEPYGLGVKDEKLFVCDGSSGLKVYDKTDVENLVLLNHFEGIITFDVIPMEDILLMVGDGILFQYRYLDAEIELISSLEL